MTLPYDIILDPTPDTDDGEQHLNLGLMLARQPGEGGFYRVDSDPGAETTEDPVYGNFGVGAGFTEQHVPGGYGWGDDVDTLTHGIVVPAGKRIEITGGYNGYADGLTCMFEFSGDLFLCSGRAIYRCTGATSTSLALVHDLGPGIAAQCAVVFDDSIYIGTYVAATGAPDYIVKYDGTTFTTSANAKRRHLAVVEWDPNGAFQRTLVGTVTTYQIQWVVTGGDPLDNADWTSPLQIGHSYYHIRKLIAAPRHIWAAKQEGVFDIIAPSDNAVHANITPHWRDSYDIENGATGAILDDHIYVAHALGIDRIPVAGLKQDIPEQCEFGVNIPFGGPVYGRPVAMTAWRGKLWVGYYNSILDTSYVMVGKPRLEPNPYGPVEWHGSYSTVPGRITFLGINSPSVPQLNESYLWIGTAVGSTGAYPIYRQYVAKSGSSYQELLSGAQPQFQDMFTWYVSDGWDAPTSRRFPYRYDVHADRLDSGTQVSVYANFDRALDSSDQTDWVLQGTSYESPRTSFIPASIARTSFRVDFKVVGQGTELAPPIFRAFQPLADVNREQAPIYAFEFWIQKDQMLKNGSTEPHDPGWILESLWSLASENGTPVTMLGDIDDDPTESVVEILPGISLGKREQRDGSWGRRVTVRVRFLYGVWYWDSGVTYDSGRFWG